MIIVWGSSLYGKTDEVPGLFHVATKFGHLWYVPLIPLGSRLVLARKGSAGRGIPIPLSWKSLLLAWGRSAALVFAGVSLLFLLQGLADRAPADVTLQALMTGLGAGAWAILAFGGPFRRASYERAQGLAETVGLSHEAWVLLEAAFGRLEGQDLPRLLEAARAKDRGAADAGDGTAASAQARDGDTEEPDVADREPAAS